MAVSGLLSLFVFAAGCQVFQEPDYAGPIAEGILLALNDADYGSYREHFDEAMLAAVTPDAFDRTYRLVKSKAGEYVSKEFWKTDFQAGFFVVFYRAKYTLEPTEVIVKVVFTKVDGEPFVTGLWFDSPNLRQ